MSNKNLRRYFLDIQEKYSTGLKGADESTYEQIRTDIEFLQMMHARLRGIRNRKGAIANLEKSIEGRSQVIDEFTDLIVTIYENFKILDAQANEKNCYFYSPYNNTKPFKSSDVLEYGKMISHSLQAPKGYQIGDIIPKNYVLPFPIPEIIIHSYLCYNSRTDGKVPIQCQRPHCNIRNKRDNYKTDKNIYYMSNTAIVAVEANDPKDCTIAFSVDGSIPTPFSQNKKTNGEIIQVTQSCTLKVMAHKAGYLDSGIVELEFELDETGNELQDPDNFGIRPTILSSQISSPQFSFLESPYSFGSLVRTSSYRPNNSVYQPPEFLDK